MNIVKELLRGIPLPRMVKVRQNFPVTANQGRARQSA